MNVSRAKFDEPDFWTLQRSSKLEILLRLSYELMKTIILVLLIFEF